MANSNVETWVKNGKTYYRCGKKLRQVVVVPYEEIQKLYDSGKIDSPPNPNLEYKYELRRCSICGVFKPDRCYPELGVDSGFYNYQTNDSAYCMDCTKMRNSRSPYIRKAWGEFGTSVGQAAEAIGNHLDLDGRAIYEIGKFMEDCGGVASKCMIMGFPLRVRMAARKGTGRNNEFAFDHPWVILKDPDSGYVEGNMLLVCKGVADLRGYIKDRTLMRLGRIDRDIDHIVAYMQERQSRGYV